jgi:hypothetical protein
MIRSQYNDFADPPKFDELGNMRADEQLKNSYDSEIPPTTLLKTHD